MSFLYTIWIESTFPLFSGFTLVVFFHHTLCCLFMSFFLYNAIFFHQVCYVNPHDLLRPYGCAMSFIMFHVFDRCIGLVLHTWCVVLKHFPCLCKMAFLFVFTMEGGGVEYLFINEALGCIAFCMLFWCIIWVLAFYQIGLNDVLTCTPTFLSIYIDCYEVECMYME